MAVFKINKRTLYVKYQWGVNSNGDAKFQEEKFDNIKADATDDDLTKVAGKISTILNSSNIYHNIKDSYDIV